MVADANGQARRETAAEWQKEHHWHPHRLRHLKASEVRKQFGLDAAQAILGHSDANVTQIYAGLDLAKAAEVARLTG